MFNPRYTLTPKIVNCLIRLESLRVEINGLPITPTMLTTLRETARFRSIHYSTKIEGNRLTQEEVIDVLKKGEHFRGKERDEKELLGYDRALDEVEKLSSQHAPVTEEIIKRLHALVMGGGRKNVKPTKYRDGQNAIRDSITNALVYLPPEAKDVPPLMKDFVEWITTSKKTDLSIIIIAGIAHYQFATIHPYYDGNGRTARLLTTLLLRESEYGLKGIYSLEDYYAQDLTAYYQALERGTSHNYYMGRETADITPWIDYFCTGLVKSFEAVKNQALKAKKRGALDKSSELKKLDGRQRKALSLFEKSNTITSADIAKLFKMSPRTARALCKHWVESHFLTIADSAKKSRKYTLDPSLQSLIR